MSLSKSLTEEQIVTIRLWADDGDTFADIQKKIGTDLNLKITYLETRFLLEDLDIQIKQAPAPEPEPEAELPESGLADGAAGQESEPAGEGGVTVSIDALLRPGAMISGKADFGGGETASWWVDQMGQLGFRPDNAEFRPTAEQAAAFQQELHAAVRKSGL